MCVPSCDENIMPMLALVLRALVDMFENSSLRLSLYVVVAGKYHIQPSSSAWNFIHNMLLVLLCYK